MRKIVGLLVLLFVVGSAAVSAAPTADYDMTNIFVNGMEADHRGMISVGLDSVAQIKVHLRGFADTENVKIRAWIGGYEYDVIEETTEMFDVAKGVSYKKTLYINIPEDLDVENHEYTLHVEAYDKTKSVKKDYTLYFEQDKHKVLVEDVLFSPTTIAPGKAVGVKVRLENQGKTFEEDLKVTVSIPELGISQRSYLDELGVNDQDEANTVFLKIPQATKKGTYIVQVDVEYNKGHTTSTDLAYLRVDTNGTQIDENAIVSISTIKDLKVGKERTFKAQITNFEESTKTFYLDVDGVHFAGASIDVAGGSTAEMYFTLNPTESGVTNVIATISTDDGTVLEKQYSVDVKEKSTVSIAAFSVILAMLIISGAVTILRH